MQPTSLRTVEGKKGDQQRLRVEKVVQTLAGLGGSGNDLAQIAHDARNMMAALGLYCDLLEEPGVLATPFGHYAQELRLVTTASRRLVEKLVALDADGTSASISSDESGNRLCERPVAGARSKELSGRHRVGLAEGDSTPNLRSRRWDLMPAVPVSNLAAELLANRNLLAALAGPTVILTIDADGGARPVRLTREDLTRVLVNLVKNAAEAMPDGGRVHISLREKPPASGAEAFVTLTIEDNGTGIEGNDFETIFSSGYTTRLGKESDASWPVHHRGLGLPITRSLVEEAGGRVWADNRKQGGSCFTIELPMWTRKS
jgi:signal transduction histidine kinase